MSDAVTHNRALYLAWLRQAHPKLYMQAISPQSMRAGLSGFWDSVGATFNSVVSNVSNALPNLANTYAQYQQSRDLIEMNNQRARQGLPPLMLQNGQLVTMSGEMYTDNEWRLASTGISPNTMLIGTAVVIGLVLLWTRS